MQRYLSLIASGTALAAAGIFVIATRQGEAPAPAADAAGQAAAIVAEAAPQPPAMPDVAALPTGPATPDDKAAAIDALTAQLSEREGALAALQATLVERDASLDEVTATLEAREAELQALRDELAALRERYAFDMQLATLKAGSPAGAAPAVGEAEPILTALKGESRRAPQPTSLTEIHFDSGSSSLSPGGQVHAAAAAVMLGGMQVARIRLVGHTDRVGSADRNRALAASRAGAVAAFLIANGVPEVLIEAAPMGEADGPVATGDGIPEPLNRTVAIIAVPLPTS